MPNSTAPENTPNQHCPLTVSSAESGMKLLRFLENRLAEDVPKTLLYKWIRTGQVRVNKGRSGPHIALCQGDEVRIPPFAARRYVAEASAAPSSAGELCIGPSPKSPLPDEPPSGKEKTTLELALGLTVPVLTAEYIVLAKPGGLATQGGTGTEDSVAKRLRSAFAGSAYIPAPAHRIDRHTSGLLVAGRTLAAQQKLHELFAGHTLEKEYLAVAAGKWPHPGPVLLQDTLSRGKGSRGEHIAALPGGETLPLTPAISPHSPIPINTSDTKDTRGVRGAKNAERGGHMPQALAEAPGTALAIAAPVACIAPEALPPELRAFPLCRESGASLLLILLLTGKKHQIRVQLSSRGHPIIGDGRYSGPSWRAMLLHAYALGLPQLLSTPCAEAHTLASTTAPAAHTNLERHSLLPLWPQPFLPDAEAKKMEATLAPVRRAVKAARENLLL